MIGNTEWPKWETVMAPDEVDAGVLAGLARNAPLTRPRLGHADLAGMQKYDWDEARPILERASARETAARVALGRVASNFLRQACGITIVSHVAELGPVRSAGDPRAGVRRSGSRSTPTRSVAWTPTPARRCRPRSPLVRRTATPWAAWSRWSPTASPPVSARTARATVGWIRSWPAGALMGIQAIKGVEVGDGFDLARTRGSLAHDEMQPGPDGVVRLRNRSGGTEGGMSNGEPLRVRAAMKPIATIPRALRTVDVATGEAAVAHHQRSDVCAVPAAGVVAEAMVALVLAEAALEKFGGDSVAETRRNPGRLRRAVGAARAAVSPSATIALIGAPGAGKSTVGHVLAERLVLPSADVDAAIEAAEGKPVPEIFADSGEAHFRALERTATLAALQQPAVVAVGGGGGAVLIPEVAEALRTVTAVWLEVSVAQASEAVPA